MALQSVTNINVDFCDKKHILINAKQFDKGSRFLSVTCYNHGDIYFVNADEHSVYVRYKKPDNHSVFNSCEIDEDGKIMVEITEQMLAVDGICFVDLVVLESGNAVLDNDTGAIVGVEGSSILSTMTFCIDVSEGAIDNADIESSYEFNALNRTLDECKAGYQNVVNTAKSWAVGGTGIREGEDINNAKYWAELAHSHVVGDLTSNVVTGIKGVADVSYRTGFIDLTAEYVGAVSIDDVATVDDVKDYLGI